MLIFALDDFGPWHDVKLHPHVQRFLALIAFLRWWAVKQSINQSSSRWFTCYFFLRHYSTITLILTFTLTFIHTLTLILRLILIFTLVLRYLYLFHTNTHNHYHARVVALLDLEPPHSPPPPSPPLRIHHPYSWATENLCTRRSAQEDNVSRPHFNASIDMVNIVLKISKRNTVWRFKIRKRYCMKKSPV